MSHKITRRGFLQKSAVAGGSLATAWHVNPGPARASKSPNEKLNIAAIGTANRAAANISGCASQNIVAVADIDLNFLNAAGTKYSGARKYRDFRVLLEKEADKIDAVIVATPDHTHAPAAAMAMRMGKHTYCEKPLTHTVYEARTLANLAAEKKLVTQMGTQIHAGENYRRVVELVQSGSIGAVKEVHVWVATNYAGGKLKPAEKPAHVDWDLWLGPAAKRDYVESTIVGQHQTVHPFHWRWFWDYGSGSLGDFGCHYMDLPFWALKLKYPTSVVATGPTPDQEATTAGLVVEYKYPARGDMPPVTMTWYDGGKSPAMLRGLKDTDGKPLNWGGSGQMFVGETGIILSNYGAHKVLPYKSGQEVKRPEPFIAKSIGHHNEWIEAIKTGGTTTCNFDYSGALTESVLLGVAAHRSGSPIEWDAKNLRVTNSKKAQAMIHKEYRKGWTL
jgi:predicted dehydrogenase